MNTIEKQNIPPGSLLISSPLLKDPNFHRSVILILDKDKDNGYIGLILNHPMDLKFEDIFFPDSEESEMDFSGLGHKNFYYGGPVDMQRLFWLHTHGKEIKNSTEILPGIYVGGDYEDMYGFISSHPSALNHSIRLYLGYSGWGKGQLENEIQQGAWCINPIPDPSSLLNDESDSFWRNQVKALYPEMRHWLILPSDPTLN